MKAYGIICLAKANILEVILPFALLLYGAVLKKRGAVRKVKIMWRRERRNDGDVFRAWDWNTYENRLPAGFYMVCTPVVTYW